VATAITRAETRADRARTVAQLRDQGLPQREIAERTGLSRSYVSELLGDTNGAKANARRDRYRGTCKGCGARTTGGDGPGAAPDYCWHCAPRTAEGRAIRTKWPADRIIAAIRWWNDAYGEPPHALDWSPTEARKRGFTVQADRAERLIAEGRIPWVTVAHNRFGSWNAALEASGFEPRAKGAGLAWLGSAQRAILDHLEDSGATTPNAVAARLDLAPSTAWKALNGLRRRGLVVRTRPGFYRLTDAT
jgi:DNA-binding MarR family transcriptional regulator